MNEVTEKYLAKMLEGAEQGLAQMDMAQEQINGQLKAMIEQREEMVTAIEELRGLLGLEDEEALDEITEVVESSDEE
jgi:Glu-tRNA(Gln) amidotransferase subunit E-like FAD-binding protein